MERRNTMEASKCTYVLPFMAILLAHAIAVVLFTRGFLLTRTELPIHSNCSDVSASPCFSPPPSSDPPSCWTSPVFTRLVVVLFDALRFDFVAPSSFFDEKKPWMDKLTLPQKLAARFRDSARLFKAIADPPTTTLQRLKGLTTGGLPTFIDIGQSFGAPAIIEDNLIYQLAKSGKKVMMMGDDTWGQLFPGHFEKFYPYPSFNVKDLDTVDDGCLEHLIPSLHRDDWDVLIAHFLGVDHAGHIFGVDSLPMMQKLEQYNAILEKVVEALSNHSEPGGIHERTLLVVMGDHGQTTNGDHGGGTPEEVETSLFAMSFNAPSEIKSPIVSSDSCRLNLDGENICINSIQQVDFAVTIAALLGVPFPFGSIGRVHPELHSLSGGSWREMPVQSEKPWARMLPWMQEYVNILCINCWQAKRYIDLYAATAVMGFSPEDLSHVSLAYEDAQASWFDTIKKKNLFDNSTSEELLYSFQRQINAYTNFLENITLLARSKWTEFNLTMMDIGLCVMLVSTFYHVYCIMRVYAALTSASLAGGNSFCSLTWAALCFVSMRASSFLSNSYILAEGKVANFLLVSAIIISIRSAIIQGHIVPVDVSVLLLSLCLRFGLDIFMRQHVGLSFMEVFSSRTAPSFFLLMVQETLPVVLLLFLAIIVCVVALRMFYCRGHAIFIFGTVLSYGFIAVHWISESNLIEIPALVRDIGKIYLPRLVYTIGSGQILFTIYIRFNDKERLVDNVRRILTKAVAMLCSWNSTILMLLGRKGSLVMLLFLFGAWCLIKLQKGQSYSMHGFTEDAMLKPMSVMQWNLLAICLFFYTGHWCAFDGLRYGAAFIGFDQFNLIRQGVLLAIDTFGVSHILPILGLPLLVVCNHQSESGAPRTLYLNMLAGFLVYGLITSVTATFTILCVRIHRRHLMVWGLFAPKYVFDVVGLMLTDVLILLASLYYF